MFSKNKSKNVCKYNNNNYIKLIDLIFFVSYLFSFWFLQKKIELFTFGWILRQNKKNFFGYLKEEKLFYVWVGDRLFFLPISLFRFLSLCRQNNTIKERHKNCVVFVLGF